MHRDGIFPGAVMPPRPVEPSLGSTIKNRRRFDAKVYSEGQRPDDGCAVCSAPENDGMTLGNGYLGSRIDEERSEMRYVV